MSNRMRLQNSRYTGLAFTLIELLATISIMLLLTVLVLPNIQAAIVRANISKVMVDMNTIAKALDLYYTDHADYPETKHLELFHSLEIHEISQFAEPNPYLSPVPHFPWEGKKCIALVQDTPGVDIIGPQGNYLVTKKRSFNVSPTRYIEQLGWDIVAGGPLSYYPGSDPTTWYTPTNGMLSRGGFIMNSIGMCSFK